MVNKRVNGSSILEIVVGLFIISLSISLSGLIFSTVFQNSERMLKQQMFFSMDVVVNETILKEDVEPIIIEKGNFTIHKNSTIIDVDKRLWLITFEVVAKHGKTKMSRKILLEK